jgi:hypothetical protein
MTYIEEKARMIRDRGARDRAARGGAGFKAELGVIPGAAWAIAVLAYLGLACGLVIAMNYKPQDWANWNDVQKILFAALIPIFIFLYVLLIGYVCGDAKRRGMRYVVWTLLAIFIPNALGIILYFLLRDPLPSTCPECSIVVGGTYAFCPKCGTTLNPACPNCHRAVDRTWSNCAYCGSKLGATSEPAA